MPTWGWLLPSNELSQGFRGPWLSLCLLAYTPQNKHRQHEVRIRSHYYGYEDE